MSIKVSKLTKRYGTQKAIDSISFEIKKGEIVGFIGPNGAGKSTTMKIITGFLPATSGEVLVGGFNIANDSIKIRQTIGYLPEHNPLYPEMYIKEFLEYSARIHKIKPTKLLINKTIQATGLELEQHKKIGMLSKGYKQRVGLAQALIHNPQVLILDEPTTGLDPNQIIEIRNLISKIGSEKTVMLSTHLMQEVEAICDRIIIINRGKIVANEQQNTIKNLSKQNIISLIVEFEDTIDIELLKNIKNVGEIISITPKKLIIRSELDIRKDIFNFAVKNKTAVLSMQKKEKTLEEIFQELTKQ